MMATHSAHDDGADTERERAIEEVSGAVQDCLAREQTLRTVIAEFYSDHVADEPVQADLAALFNDNEALLVLARLASDDMLEEALAEGVQHEFLTESEQEEFESLWEEIGWIASGAHAYEMARQEHPQHWTEKDLDIGTMAGELVVEHSISFGADTIHDIRVPAWKFFVDAVQRLQYVGKVLPMAIEKGDVEPEALAKVLETQATLVSVADQLDALESERPAESEPGAENSETTQADDPVFTGEELDRTETDEDDSTDAASIGFQ